jgi:D-alanyl-D-alanine carboxypeptidase
LVTRISDDRGAGRLLWAGVLLWLSAASAAQPAPAADAALAHLRAVLQAELTARYAAATTESLAFPGATVAVGLPDGRVFELATGFADTSRAIPMTPDSRMPSGSIGKTFVSALTLHLVEQGVLDLDDRLADWLGHEPWFHRLPNGNAITLRQLLNHSSGLINHVFDPQSGFADHFRQQALAGNLDRGPDPEQLVGFVLDHEPLFAPGEGFHYSDTNYILVGLVIERASGEDYYDLLRDRILEPLDLDATAPLIDRRVDRLPQGYAPQSRELFGIPVEVVGDDGLVFDPSIEWTGGGLVTMSSDLVRWARALFDGRFLSRTSLQEMLGSIAVPEEREPAATDRAFGYGLGIGVTHMANAVAYRHGGFFPGYHSMLAYFPSYGFAIAMQINSDSSDIEDHVEALAGLVIAELGSSFSPVSTVDTLVPHQEAAVDGDSQRVTGIGRFAFNGGTLRMNVQMRLGAGP